MAQYEGAARAPRFELRAAQTLGIPPACGIIQTGTGWAFTVSFANVGGRCALW
jgi:hypothetical protein